MVAATCCGLATMSAIEALSPPAPLTIDVVVPVRRLEPGLVISAKDVARQAVPAKLAPAAALTDLNDVIGRVPVVSLAAGMPLTADLVVGGEVAALAPAGTVVTPVRLADATAALLRPGDHVDLVSAAFGVEDATYLARRALVLPMVRAPAESRPGLFGGIAVEGSDGLVLLAVSPDEASAVSVASLTGVIAAVLVP